MRSLSRGCLLVFSLVAVVSGTAYGAGSSFTVQAPEIKAPGRGSVAGAYAELSFGPGSMSRGSFALPLPIELPAERGRCLVNFLPTYAPQHGQSAWGMGWSPALEIRREPIAGELDYDVPDFVSPWGRIVAGDGGKWYVDGLQSHVVITASGTGWRAVDPAGTIYDFAPGLLNGTKVFSWELVRATDIVGGVTELRWEEQDGQRLLKSVIYGSAMEPARYTVTLAYEAATLSFVSYRSGRAERITRRVKTVSVQSGTRERWHYDLSYKENGLSPAFYLVGVQKVLAAGGTEPPVTYGYGEADKTLAELVAAPLAAATDYVRTSNDVTAFSYAHATHVDANRDGRLDLERTSDFAMLMRTDQGWTAEPLGPRPDNSYWSFACRPQPSPGNAPRTLARLDGWEGDLQVFRAIYQGPLANPDGTVTPAHTKIARCNRDGGLRSVENVAGRWELSPTVRLVDVNRDTTPDLLRIDTSGFEIVVNPGHGQPFGARRSGRLYTATGATLPFSPQRLWFEDLNGDGIGDIVTTNGAALFVWYGKGHYEYVDRAVTMSLYRRQGTSWVVDGVGERTVNFVDVNNDGLTDVLLASGSEARLYASWGHVFVHQPTQAFQFGYTQGWAMEQPVLADLDADGNDELVYAGYNHGVAEVRGMQVSPAGTGLLAFVNDGKGSKVSFAYGRGPATVGAGVRPVVLTELRTRTVGLDADAAGTQFGELIYRYDYRVPVLHRRSHAFLGFASTLRRGPHGVEVVNFRHDDHWVDVVDASLTYPLGDAWAGQRAYRMHQFERFSYTPTSFAGVPMLRLDRSSAGWGRHPRPADEKAPASFFDVAGPFEELAVTKEFLGFDGICVTRSRTISSRGSLTTDTGLAQISLNGALHCVPTTESITGSHADPTDDFQIAQTMSRNAFGQVTKVWQGSPSSQVLVQSVEYDGYGRVTRLSTPGMTGEVATTIAYAGAMPRSITGPDGVRTEVSSYDALTDQIRAMYVDRAGTTHQDYFEYDQLERLARHWDSAGASSQTQPLETLAYVYPTDDSLGRTEATALIAPASQGKAAILQHGVTWHSGDGHIVASGALAREGWLISGLNARSRNQGWQRGYIRSPIASTSPPAFSYAMLFDGAEPLSFAQRDGMGEAAEVERVLAEGVTQKRKLSYAWTPEGIMEVSSENGTHVDVVKRDVDGTVLWHADPSSLVTYFHHDVAGRLRSLTMPDGSTQSVSFDAFGRPARVHRADVGDVAYRYDQTSSWLLGKDFYDAEGVLYRSVTNTYDSIGRAITTTSTAPDRTPRVITRYYDGTGPSGSPVIAGQLGRLSRVVGNGFSKEVRSNPDGTEDWARIRIGNFVSVESTTSYFVNKSPHTVTVIVRNLATGQIIDQSVRELVYDQYGRLDVVKLNGTDLLAVDYDSEGRVSSVGFASGESVDFSHDRVTRAINGYTHHTGSLWSSAVTWKLDVHGEVVREDYSFAAEANGAPAYTGAEISRGYEYDARGFLHRSTDNGTETGYYEYDNAGMMTFTRDLGGARSIGRPRDRHQVVDGVEYAYDAAGRVTAKGELRYGYGADGDVAEVSGPDGVFRYYYDDLGQRVLKTKVAGGVETPQAAFIDGDYITATRRIEPLALGGRLMGVLENGRFRMLATDPRGTTLADLDGTVNLASPYGLRAERPDLSEALDFAEKGFDPQLQLVRMGVRDYDPVLGQFTRPDPLFMESVDACAASVVECNLFGYALNNPVSVVDPTGTNGTPADGFPSGDRMPEGHQWTGQDGSRVFLFSHDEIEFSDHGKIPSEGESPGLGAGGQGGSGAKPQDVLHDQDTRSVVGSLAGIIGGSDDQDGGGEGGDEVYGRPGGMANGAFGGTEDGARMVPILSGMGLFGKFSEWASNLLPKVEAGTAQAMDGARIVLDILSGATGPLMKAAKEALFEGTGKLGKIFKWVRCANSFAAGTLVRTPAGLVPIEQLEEGDLVWSRDEVSGVEGWRPITGTIVGHKPVIEITTRGPDGSEVIAVTANHPMAVVARGFVDAGDLVVGDRLQSADGRELVVVALRSRPQSIPVFNFEVAEFHTYFVGEEGAWAHNCPTKTDRIKKHLLNGELEAAPRELAGEVVARKADGTPWNHVHEVQDAQRGLLKRIDAIKAQLSRNSLDAATRAALESELSQASRLLDFSEFFVPR